MKLFFSDVKKETSHEILLPKLCFKYVKDIFDGKLYTNIITDKKDNLEIATDLINCLNPLIVTKKSAIILNLLVNPYFDELCYLVTNGKILSQWRLKILEKHVFKYLSSDLVYKSYSSFQDNAVEGSKFYKDKNIYNVSKSIIDMFERIKNTRHLNIYEKIKYDFSFVETYGYKFRNLFESYIAPSVMFSNGKDEIQIGMDYEEGRMFISWYEKNIISPVIVLENVDFESKEYVYQVDKAKEELIDFLNEIN